MHENEKEGIQGEDMNAKGDRDANGEGMQGKIRMQSGKDRDANDKRRM